MQSPQHTFIAKQLMNCIECLDDEHAQVSPPLWAKVEPHLRSIKSEAFLRMHSTRIASGVTDDEHSKSPQIFKSLCSDLDELLQSDVAFLNFAKEKLVTLAEVGLLLPKLDVPSRKNSAQTINEQILKLTGEFLRYTKPKTLDDTKILVVLSFRCGPDESYRKRNLLACIHALWRQTLSREYFFIIAVEQDAADYNRVGLADVVDHYIFAQNSGSFNAAWGRNIGVRHGPHCPIVCLLDVDALIHKDFLANLSCKFEQGVEAIVPFDRALWLDEEYSSAMVDGLLADVEQPNASQLRGYILSDIHGFVVSCTRERYLHIGGQDERYSGWGDEDNEFYQRLMEHGSVHKFPGWVFHLFHPRPVMVEAGKRLNSRTIGVARLSSDKFGDVQKYHSISSDPVSAQSS